MELTNQTIMITDVINQLYIDVHRHYGITNDLGTRCIVVCRL